MKKKISAIWIIPLVIVCFIVVFIYSINQKRVGKNIIVETNSYKETEMEQLKSSNDLKEYISSIDNILLNTLNIEDTNKLSSDDKIAIIINYISKNEEKFKNKMVNLHKQFIYNDIDTEYASIGYMDKKDFIEIANMYFDVTNKEIESSKFYDKDSTYIAIVPVMPEYISYDNSNIEDVSVDNQDIYNVHIKYHRNVYGKTNEINVLYRLEKSIGKYKFLSYKIINSTVY